MKIDTIVTGTGRSGTNFIARYLTSLGKMCGHESIFGPEGIEDAIEKIKGTKKIQTSKVSQNNTLRDEIGNIKVSQIDEWFAPERQSGDSSYMAAPFLDHDLFKECKIVHIYRDPIKVVSSTVIDAEFFSDPEQLPYYNFVRRHLPEIDEYQNILDKAMCYYLGWNNMIEMKCKNKSFIRLRIEDQLPILLDFLLLEDNDASHKDKTTNSWHKRKKDISFWDLPSGKLRDNFAKFMTDRGYKIKRYL